MASSEIYYTVKTKFEDLLYGIKHVMDLSTYPCPSCGFLVFDEPPGSYAICQICGWEDDHVQLSHPTMRGGANGVSLQESQREILANLPAKIREHRGLKRDASWRPLTESDCIPDATAPNDGLSYFHAAVAESPTYYWLRPSKAQND